MANNLYLTLMMGSVIPNPVSQDVINALTSVQVTNTVDGPSVFQLQFTLSNRSPLHTIFLLSGQSPIPMVRVVILVSFKGNTQRLIDGVITRQEVLPGTQEGFSTLAITGEDLTKMMDYVPCDDTPFPCTPDHARVQAILTKYLSLGILPMVIPSVTSEASSPTDHIPRQQGTDLQYIRYLADRAGYTFFVDYPMANSSRAYWGPHIKLGMAQRALNTNMDAYTNVESLNFNFDAEKKVLPIVVVQEKRSGKVFSIPVPTDLTPLNPPLGLVSPLPKRTLKIRGTEQLSLAAAAALGLTYAAKSADGVKGSGSLDVSRYGNILTARSLVGVRGAGLAFDGLYYVAEVTHKIKRGEYKQDFKLVRNGLISTVPVVPV